jgi:hypothetical protein
LALNLAVLHNFFITMLERTWWPENNRGVPLHSCLSAPLKNTQAEDFALPIS